MPNYYPIMLDVRRRPALVIGGNRIAAEKAAALAASGAEVAVIHPDFCEELLLLAQRHEVTLRYKAYEPGDLAGAFVVVAATDDPRSIEAIWTETQQRGQLVNIVDVPARCSFIVPSILRRDQLTIAVSTEGASPSLAKRIRHYLEGFFPPAYGAYLRLAASARGHMRRHGLSYAQRDAFFGDFFDSSILGLLAEKDETAALATTVDLLHSYHVDIEPETLAKELQEVGEVR
ncbi:MAG: bifunctional precorrin-2 dehydrogenase/sirohydrochlorin ferrochelatase [Ktedonobacteraceae bacterium]|nr:bifunctional precorrin-2 dehydrogenase/sirohydrochlorin ferrochelatase [Ktedonobacteraceae bacterium]